MIRINLHPSRRHPKWTYSAVLLAVVFLVLSFSGARDLDIIDGVEAKPGELPAVVSIKVSDGPKVGAGDISCAEFTGFLVHPRLILTAAHCLTGNASISSITSGPIPRAKDRSSRRAAAKAQRRMFRVAEIGAYPGFSPPTESSTAGEKEASASTDIAYVVLKEEVADFAPIPIHATSTSAPNDALKGREASLVGYGVTRWEKELKDYANQRAGIKRIGKKPITSVHAGYVMLAGEKGGSLPGDSGGPILVEFDGVAKAVALNHGMSQGYRTVPSLDRQGNPKLDKDGQPKTEEVFGYLASIGTLLTEKNLCWVEKSSGIDLAGVECPKDAK